MKAAGFFLAAGLLAASALSGKPAHAESGWVSGTWQLWNKNGNYCASGADCAGAQYPQSQYDNKQPLRHIQVFIEHDTAGVIGQGSTDNNGNYNIQWSVSGTLPNKDKTRVWVRPWHKDNRFRVNNPSGTYPNNWTGYFTIQAGTTEGSPQSRGTFCVGSCTTSTTLPHYNVFWATQMSWRYRLSTSGWFDAYLTGTEIRGFQDNIPGFKGDCPSSCASGNTIQLDAAAGYRPQARIMHELGHIAIENSQNWSLHSDCYKKDSAAFSWDYTTDEWACGGFEEAFATLLADTTLYTHNATTPRTCRSDFACTTNNIEASPGGGCPASEKGWALTHIRYLWDVFDNVDDGETLSEGAAGRWWRLYRVYQHYPTGTGTNQNNEHWKNDFSELDDKDGRGSRSYRQNYINSYSFDTTTARTLNCNPL